MSDGRCPPLSEAVVDFIEGPTALLLASRGADHVPSLMLGRGCRVAADRGSVTVFVNADGAESLLADVEGCAELAVVFSQPSSNRTLQLKGSDARRVPLTAADHASLARKLAILDADLSLIGFVAPYTQTLLSADTAEPVALRFTPTAVFEQTPGPRAGAPLEPEA